MDRLVRSPVATGCALVMLLAAGSARADTSGMDWLGIAYLWAADIEVDARDRTLDIAFSDTVENLEMGFQGHVEAQGDDFGGFVDVSFMGVGKNQQVGQTQVNVDVDMSAMDLALVWSPGPERLRGLEAYGGLRYVNTDFDLVVRFPVQPPPPLRMGIDNSYYDFLIGGRYAAPINDNWRLVFNADLSGGDTEGTWSVGGFGVYQTGPHHFFVGYRHFEMEVKDRAAERVEETYSGPLIAYGFSF
jgi:hypothetical protein